MYKQLILFACLSMFALACHPSCRCARNSNVCLSCVDPNSAIDTQIRSCPCNPGWFTNTLSPFTCAQRMNVDDTQNDISIIMNACNIELGQKVDKIIVDTNCFFENINDKSYVQSQASLNLDALSLSDVCKEVIRTKLQYQKDGVFIDLPAAWVIEGQLGAKSAQFPLIDIFDFATTTTWDADQITQVVHLSIHIGHPDKFLRIHKWDLIVYTNRAQVQVFTVDVDEQQTSGCQDGQECIVIADLTTEQLVCADITCTSQRPSNIYEVGDIFIAKITFTDPTYTKKLQFVSFLLKTEANKVYDETAYTTAVWSGNGLIVSAPLEFSSNNLIIQIKMLIAAGSRLRVLDTASDVTTTKVQLVAQVNDSSAASNTDNTSTVKSSANSSRMLSFGLAVAGVVAALLL